MVLLFLPSDSFIEMAETLPSESTELYPVLFKALGQGWERTAGWHLEKNVFFSTASVVFSHVSLVMPLMGVGVLSCINCVFSTEFNDLLFLTRTVFKNEVINFG